MNRSHCFRIGWAIAFAATILACASCCRCAVLSTQPATAPATEVQVHDAVHRLFSAETRKMGFEALDELDKLAWEGNGTLIIQQTIIELAPQREPEWALEIGNLAGKLAPNIGTHEIIYGAAPLLKSNDPDVRNLSDTLLRVNLMYGDLSKPGADLSSLSDYIKNNEMETSSPLTNLMFKYTPEVGLAVMAEVKDDSEMKWSSHLIAEVMWREKQGFGDKVPADRVAAIEQLKILAKRPEWWARLYVADVMSTYSALADPGTLKTLMDDPDSDVRQAAKPASK